MTRFAIRFFIFLLLSWVSLGVVEAREELSKGDIVVIPLQGEVAPSLALFLRRAVKEAETAGASAMI
jgi:membrane-bound ClpP family serine protease